MSATVLPSEPVPQSERWLRWACLAATLVALVPGIELISWVWSRSEYLAHGYLIPPLSAALLYARRDEIVEAIRSSPAPRSGPFWVLLAALFEAVAVAGEISSAAGIGIPLLLAAVAYAVAGRPLLRVAALPLALLALVVPPPGFVQDRALLALKAVVMKTSVAILQTFGYTVAGLGNRILIPGQELFVANACSGLTSIVTLSPLAVVVAYFLSHGIWRRALVIASVLPLAMATNIARVTLTVALVSRFGPSFAEGLAHDGFGLASFIVGTAGMIGVARWLR
jgi:exosortase